MRIEIFLSLQSLTTKRIQLLYHVATKCFWSPQGMAAKCFQWSNPTTTKTSLVLIAQKPALDNLKMLLN